MSRTLLIIDMQSGFRAARNENLVANVCREVKLAKKRMGGIIVVEYVGYDYTSPKIIESIGSYDRMIKIKKDDDDGGKIAYEAALDAGFDLTCWRVCGVNIAYCVSETVATLRKIIPAADIEIRKSACNCVSSSPWRKFRSANGTAVRTV